MRRYASESTQNGSSNALLYGGLGVGALGGGYWYYNRQKTGTSAPAGQEGEKNVQAQAYEPSKVFIGGEQGFVPLALDKIDDINHNTKRFRFKFDDSESVSGLHIASALITKFKGENDEKPTVKPYTPVSDAGNIIIVIPEQSKY